MKWPVSVYVWGYKEQLGQIIIRQNTQRPTCLLNLVQIVKNAPITCYFYRTDNLVMLDLN